MTTTIQFWQREIKLLTDELKLEEDKNRRLFKAGYHPFTKKRDMLWMQIDAARDQIKKIRLYGGSQS